MMFHADPFPEVSLPKFSLRRAMNSHRGSSQTSSLLGSRKSSMSESRKGSIFTRSARSSISEERMQSKMQASR
ncbi:uncharacterized protein LDX57_012129 [Aspergillus melleus]|uniref:uncharacterized protein n=1 Tax=Aspergillus melleus TaxID=138277 RepID=UPI001E8CA475|nr:uncharacterized protein LDX57_012129 [Aspergillus melleus]KAH8434484.1 hypothetical protein LDX57_012129 [Aspergillus melleus]